MGEDRNELLERALRARARFEKRGNRFLGQSLRDFDCRPDGAFYELTVLCAMLEAYEKQIGTVIFFQPRDPLRPIYEAADIVIARKGMGYLTVEVKSHRAGALQWEGGEIKVPYGKGKGRKLKAVIPQARAQWERLKKKLEDEEKKSKKGRGPRQTAPPGGFVMVFPRIMESDFDNLAWASNPLPREQILFEESLAGAALRKAFSHAAKIAATGRGWKRPITERHIRLIEHVLGGLPKNLRGEERERPAGTLGGEICR